MSSVLANSKYISADDIILNLGQPFRAKQRPDDIPIGRPNECYDNAMKLVMQHPDRFVYVEGYALSPKMAFPVFHAWVLDEDALIIDNTPTWPDPTNSAYWGVAMPKQTVLAAAIRNGHTGVFEADWHGDFYFVREGWRDCV